jgi:hypothetical protein
MTALPLKTCPACLGRGQRLANSGTGLLKPCPAKGCTAKAKVAEIKHNGHETIPTKA